MAFGTGSNTYRMPGITSAASLAAQSPSALRGQVRNLGRKAATRSSGSRARSRLRYRRQPVVRGVRSPSRDADPCFGRSGEPAEIFPRRTDAASGVPQGMSETVRGPGGALLQPPGSAPAIGVISARHFRARAVASPASCRGRNQGGQNVRAPSCGALLIRALLSWGLMTGKRSVLVSLSRSRVRVCIKLLTAPDFCNGRTWCRSCADRKGAPR